MILTPHSSLPLTQNEALLSGPLHCSSLLPLLPPTSPLPQVADTFAQAKLGVPRVAVVEAGMDKLTL